MKNITYFISILILGLIPFLVATIIIFGIHGKLITDHSLVTSEVTLDTDPRQYIDELYYWHQIDTYHRVGFDGGYYTIAENPAKVEMFHFFAWGPFPIIFYGTIANLIGFSNFKFILTNAILFALRVGILAYVIKLNKIQIVMMAVLFAVYPNIALYVPTILLEMINLIIAVNLAIVFYKLIGDDHRPSLAFISISLFLLIFAGLLRVSWAIVYPPFFMMVGWKLKGQLGGILGLLLSVVLGIMVYAVFNVTAAPFESLVALSGDTESVFQAITSRTLYNLSNILFGLTFWVLLRFAALMVLVGVAYQGVLLLFKKSELYRVSEVLFHLINIFGILSVNLVLYWYVEGRDFRIIGPHLLLSVLLLIMFKRYRLIFPVLMVFVFGFPNLLETHAIWTGAHFNESEFDILSYQNDLVENGIVYIESENAWCNTVLFTNELKWYPEYLEGIEGGLGLTQFVSIEEYDAPPRSQYIMLDYETIPDVIAVWELEPLLEFPQGIIYRNLDSDCP